MSYGLRPLIGAEKVKALPEGNWKAGVRLFCDVERVMTFSRILGKSALSVTLLLAGALGQGQFVNAGEADQVRKTVEQSIEVLQQTQKKEDAWAGRRIELVARYQSLVVEKDRLEKSKAVAQERLGIEEKLVAEAERRAAGADWIEKELQSYLETVVTGLDEFVKRDLPFLPKERSDRIGSLKEVLARSDAAGAEKYRRVMEALQVETEYGRSVEVYQDTVEIEGQPLLLDILRLGRLSLFCRTPDGSVVGHFDRAAGKYVSLPSKYHREIEKAMEIARRERTTDLIGLPVGRIVVQ
jgi:hypothetical protein